MTSARSTLAVAALMSTPMVVMSACSTPYSGEDLAEPAADAAAEVGAEAAEDAPADSSAEMDADAMLSAEGGGKPGAPSGVAASTVVVTTIAGSASPGFQDGTGSAARFKAPRGIALDGVDNIYVADVNNHRIRKVTPAGVVTTLAGSGAQSFAEGTGAAASFSNPYGVGVDTNNNVYVADASNRRIRMVTPAGVVTTLAGSGESAFADGTGAAAKFNDPWGVAVNSAGGNVFVSDLGNQRIRQVTFAGVVTTLAGSGSYAYVDATGAAASFQNPDAIASDLGGNLFVSEYGKGRIRKITPAGVVTTLAGSAVVGYADGVGLAARFSHIKGLAVDIDGNLLVADSTNQRIRKVTPAGVVTTYAGGGSAVGIGGFADGPGATAKFYEPAGIAVDFGGSVFVADEANNRIRRIDKVGINHVIVSWTAPSISGSSAITSYAASASAPGQATVTCTTTGATFCEMFPLFGNITYSVTVTATNAAGTSPPSSPAPAATAP
jgi:sugar lactone lactonase YvrE